MTRILIVAIHYPVASGRYCADALRRMGHEVRTIGPETGAEIWGMTVDEKYIWRADVPADDWIPDLILVMDAHIALPAEWKFDCPVVVYGVDNHVRDYRQFDGMARAFFFAHNPVGNRVQNFDCKPGESFIDGMAINMLTGEGPAYNITWLPCGYDPVAFTPGPPYAERSFDAAIIGVLYNRRAELLGELVKIPNVRIAYGTGDVYDQYAARYHDAKVSLVRSAAGDVAQRVWETAAMGCLILMDDCPDCAALGLRDSENCLIYHSVAEAVDQLKWAMAHPDIAEEIALGGYQWAAPGTWDARCQVILEWLAGKKQEKPKRQKATEKSE